MSDLPIMYACVHTWSPQRASDPLKLMDLWIVGRTMWFLGTAAGSSAKATSAHNCLTFVTV